MKMAQLVYGATPECVLAYHRRRHYYFSDLCSSFVNCISYMPPVLLLHIHISFPLPDT